MSDPWADPEAQEWLTYVRDNVLPMVEDSSVCVSICPTTPDKVDIKFAVELGMMIMLDKPVIVNARPGTKIPAKLRLVADKVVVADITTPKGRMKFMEALQEFQSE